MSCKILVVSEKDEIPTQPVDGKPTYVYWKILGLAQSARLALMAAKVDFVDVQISAEMSKDGWVAAKHTPEMEQCLTFPNLPYFLHPGLGNRGIVQVRRECLLLCLFWILDLPCCCWRMTCMAHSLTYITRPFFSPCLSAALKNNDLLATHTHAHAHTITQSDAILRFIGQKYDMLGASAVTTDMYLEHLHDAEVTIARLSYGAGPEKVLAWYKGSVPDYLKPFGKLLDGTASDKKYLSAKEDTPSVADFKLYVLLYKLSVMQAQLGDDSTKAILEASWIKEYMGRIEAIPAIKAFMESPSYMKGPMNNPSALWRGM